MEGGRRLTGIHSDLKELALLATAFGQQQTIYILYGSKAAATCMRVRAIAKQFDALAPIELSVHSQPGLSAMPAIIPLTNANGRITFPATGRRV